MGYKNLVDNILLRIPLALRANSGPGQFAGITAVASNATTVTISTTAVKSDSLIFLTAQALTNQASGSSTPLEVRSIVHGSYFIVGNAGGEAIAARTSNIFWMIVQKS
jgi:hypothetical protein